MPPLKEFKGILNTPPTSRSQAVKRGVAGIVFGALLIVVASWILFIKLQFLSVPRLALYFPGSYILLFIVLILGLLIINDLLPGCSPAVRRGYTRGFPFDGMRSSMLLFYLSGKVRLIVWGFSSSPCRSI